MHTYSHQAPVTMNGESHNCIHTVTARSEKGPKSLTVVWVDGKRYGAYARKHHNMRLSMLSFHPLETWRSSALVHVILESHRMLTEVPFYTPKDTREQVVKIGSTLPEVYYRRRE